MQILLIVFLSLFLAASKTLAQKDNNIDTSKIHTKEDFERVMKEEVAPAIEKESQKMNAQVQQWVEKDKDRKLKAQENLLHKQGKVMGKTKAKLGDSLGNIILDDKTVVWIKDHTVFEGKNSFEEIKSWDSVSVDYYILDKNNYAKHVQVVSKD